jgi:hypothetical protein
VSIALQIAGSIPVVVNPILVRLYNLMLRAHSELNRCPVRIALQISLLMMMPSLITGPPCTGRSYPVPSLKEEGCERLKNGRAT